MQQLQTHSAFHVKHLLRVDDAVERDTLSRELIVVTTACSTWNTASIRLVIQKWSDACGRCGISATQPRLHCNKASNAR